MVALLFVRVFISYKYELSCFSVYLIVDRVIIICYKNIFVQVFDNTPASREGTLQSGDELVGVNGQSVKGKTKVEVAKMIQSAKVSKFRLCNILPL